VSVSGGLELRSRNIHGILSNSRQAWSFLGKKQIESKSGMS